MWEWLTTQGRWILASIAGALVLFLFFLWLARHAIRKIVPEQWREALKGAEKITSRVLITVLGIILALAAVAIILPHYGVNVTPALGIIGGWLWEHGIRILLIIFLTYLSYQIARVVIRRSVFHYVEVRGKGRHSRTWFEKREETLSALLVGTIGTIIFMIDFSVRLYRSIKAA